MFRQDLRSNVPRKGDLRRRASGTGLRITGLKFKDVVSAMHFIMHGVVQTIFKLWDLNPVSLVLRRRKQTGNPVATLGSRPRLWDLFTNLFLSYEGRKRKMLSWVHSVLPGHRDDVMDFGSSWQDGLVLCGLMESLRPGSCPQFKLLKPHHRVNNCRIGLQLAVSYLDISQAPLSPEEMSLAETETEVKLVHLIQMVMWRYLKQGQKVKVTPASRDHDQLPCRCQARGTGIKAGIVGRRTKFNIFADIVLDLELHIEIKGPNNEYNKENIISMTSAATSKYRNHVISNPEDDGKSKLIRDGAGHSFLRQKSLDEDLSHLIIPFDYQCVGEGRFLVTYIPRSAGLHYITVLSKGRHIQGSPFEVKVSDWVSTWNLVPKARVVPFDMLNTIEETSKEDTKFQSPAIHKLRRKLSHVAIMSKQINLMKRRILKKVITQGGEEIICDVTPSPSLSGQSTPDLSKGEESQGTKRHPLEKDRSCKGREDDKDLQYANSNANSDLNKNSPRRNNTKSHRCAASQPKSSLITSRNLESTFTTRKAAGLSTWHGRNKFKPYESSSKPSKQSKARRLQALTTDDLPALSQAFCSNTGRNFSPSASREGHSPVRKTKSYDFPSFISQHGVFYEGNLRTRPQETSDHFERKQTIGNGQERSHTVNDLTEGISVTGRTSEISEGSNDTQITPDLLTSGQSNQISPKSHVVSQDNLKSMGVTSGNNLDTLNLSSRTDSTFNEHDNVCLKQPQQTVSNDKELNSEHDAIVSDTNLSLSSTTPESEIGVSRRLDGNLKDNQIKGQATPCAEKQPDCTMSEDSTQDKKVKDQCSLCGISLPSSCSCLADSGNESTKGESDEDLNPSPTVCVECCSIHPDHFHSPDKLSQSSPCYCLTKLSDDSSNSVFNPSQKEYTDNTINRSQLTSNSTEPGPSFSFREGPWGLGDANDTMDPTSDDSLSESCQDREKVSREIDIDDKCRNDAKHVGPNLENLKTRNTVTVLQNTTLPNSNFYLRWIKLKRSRSLDDVPFSANEDLQEVLLEGNEDLEASDLLRRRSRLTCLKKAWHTFDHGSQTYPSLEKQNTIDWKTQKDVTRQDSDRKISLTCHSDTGEEILQVCIENDVESHDMAESSSRCDEEETKNYNTAFEEERDAEEGEKENEEEEVEEEEDREEKSLTLVSPCSIISDTAMELMKSSPVFCNVESCSRWPSYNDAVLCSPSLLTPNPSPSSFGTNKSDNSDWSDAEDAPTSRTRLVVFEAPDGMKERWSPQFVDYYPMPKYSGRRSSGAGFLPVISSPENPISVPSCPLTFSEFIVQRESWLEESSNPTEDSSFSGSLSGGEANPRDTFAAVGQNKLWDRKNIANVAANERVSRAALVCDSKSNETSDESNQTSFDEMFQGFDMTKTRKRNDGYIQAEQSEGETESVKFKLKPRYKAFTVISGDSPDPSNFFSDGETGVERSDDTLQNAPKTRLYMRVPSTRIKDSAKSQLAENRELDDIVHNTSSSGRLCSQVVAVCEGCEACEQSHLPALASLGDEDGKYEIHYDNTNHFKSPNGSKSFDGSPIHRAMSPFERVLTPTKFRRSGGSPCVKRGECSCQCECKEWPGCRSPLDAFSGSTQFHHVTNCSCDSLVETPCRPTDFLNETESEHEHGHERSLTPTKYRNSLNYSDGAFREANRPSISDYASSRGVGNYTKISMTNHPQADGLQNNSLTRENCSCSSKAKNQNAQTYRPLHCTGRHHNASCDGAGSNSQNARQWGRFHQNRDCTCLYCYRTKPMITVYNRNVHVCSCHVRHKNQGGAMRYNCCAFSSCPNSNHCCHRANCLSLISETARRLDVMPNSNRFLKRRTPLYHTAHPRLDPCFLSCSCQSCRSRQVGECSSLRHEMDCNETSDVDMMTCTDCRGMGALSSIGDLNGALSVDEILFSSSQMENPMKRATFDKFENQSDICETPVLQFSNSPSRQPHDWEQGVTRLNEATDNETLQFRGASQWESVAKRKHVFQNSNVKHGGELQRCDDKNEGLYDKQSENQRKPQQTGQSDCNSNRLPSQFQYKVSRKTSQPENINVKKTGILESNDNRKTVKSDNSYARITHQFQHSHVRTTDQSEQNGVGKEGQYEHNDAKSPGQIEHKDVKKTRDSEHSDWQAGESQAKVEMATSHPQLVDWVNRSAPGIHVKRVGGESDEGSNPTRQLHGHENSSPARYREEEPFGHGHHSSAAVAPPNGRRAVILNFSGSLSTTDTLDSGIHNVY